MSKKSLVETVAAKHMNRQALTLPTVTKGGTDKRSLMVQYMDVSNEVSSAIRLMQQASPHGRDFPNEEQLAQATAEWSEQLKKLESVEAWLRGMIEGIDDQG